MAKIQIYLPVENEKIGEPVIKVSDFKAAIEKEMKAEKGIVELDRESCNITFYEYMNKIKVIDRIRYRLLAAIDTEGK